MELNFEEELKKLRKKTEIGAGACFFEDVLFQTQWSFVDASSMDQQSAIIEKNSKNNFNNSVKTSNEQTSSSKSSQETVIEQSAASKKETSAQSEFSAEKEVVFNSLKQFADKKMEESASDSFKVPGGLVERKLNLPSDYSDFIFEDAEILDLEHLKSFDKYQKLALKSDVKVCFLTDSPKDTSSSDEFMYYFEEETAHLFQRMVKAMKLSDQEFFISDVQTQELLNKELSIFKPRYVISLGATAAHQILKMKERLSKIHGHFYKKAIKYSDDSTFELEITPIFHPEFLRINPNMKKTAWVDMQKVMDKLGKLS